MKALVTGGGGFLGGAVVRKLLQAGSRVRSFSRGTYPELSKLGVEVFRGDLADPEAVAEACRGCDAVFHVAAKAGIWGEWCEYYQANVKGTENVIRACRSLKIGRLVYTSSPSVVFNGRNLAGVDESAPYASRYKAAYPETKALAEAAVLAANGGQLATVALRPHLIWGPRDTHLIPGILSRGRAGRLVKIGRVSRLVDFTYVDNAARAHLLAARHLSSPHCAAAGRAFFISNGEPMPLWDFVNAVLHCAGLPPVRRALPRGLAYTAGWMLEMLYRTFSVRGDPPLTRFLVEELATTHWFDISAARRLLGYRPEVSTRQGFQRLSEWLRPSAA